MPLINGRTHEQSERYLGEAAELLRDANEILNMLVPLLAEVKNYLDERDDERAEVLRERIGEFS